MSLEIGFNAVNMELSGLTRHVPGFDLNVFVPLLVFRQTDWHALGFVRAGHVLKLANSACCVLGVRCRFYVNTLFGTPGGTHTSFQDA